MDIKDGVRDLARRADAASTAQTEEATKNAVILPFIGLLGFDIFDLGQVIPEFTSDVGTKKGEKVDYALCVNGDVKILIEAKPITSKLSDANFNQLYRYFGVTEAEIGILSNGRQYHFYTDLDAPNKMDQRPFFVLNLEDYDDSDIKELEKFHKERFDIGNLKETATTLKYTHAAIEYLSEQMENPDDDFVRLVGRKFYDGNITKSIVDQLRSSIQSAFTNIVKDRLREGVHRFQLALSDTEDNSDLLEIDSKPDIEAPIATNGIITTEEEIQGLMVIRAIGMESIDPDRIDIRDGKSYCAVLLDNNNRRPICRFWFDGISKKYLGLIDEDRNETRHVIASLSDIYKFRPQILEAIARYAD